jgi:restriction endonuclease BglII
MGLDLIPARLRERFLFEERHHALSILSIDFSKEFDDIMLCLDAFRLKKSDILTPGGGRSPIPIAIDGFLGKRRWAEKRFDIKIEVDDKPIPIPTHKIDNFKNRVGVEVEWNNKTEFYDRDLNNFRLLWEMRVLSVGVIITRLSELQNLFDELGKGPSYGNSTTHWDKLIPKVESGGAGGCPLLLIGLGISCYDSEQ